jgi:hypothetical protein
MDAVREDGVVALIRVEGRADVDLDATPLEPSRGILAEPTWDLGKDLRRRVDENPALRDLAKRGIPVERILSHVVELRECLDACIPGADEHESELRRVVRVNRGAFELEEDAVAKSDRIGEVLEPDPVLLESGDGKNSRPRSERDDEALVADLERPCEGGDDDRSAGAVVARDVAEQQLRMRAHLTEWYDDVAGLERARRRLREERRVQHEVLLRHDRGAVPFQEPCDVAPGEAASEDERATACFASLHGSCLPRCRARLQ